MKAKTDVHLVSCDHNWEALYINAKLVYEDHNISVRDFMGCLDEAGLVNGITFNNCYVYGDEANERIEKLGHMSDNFAEIMELLKR